MKGVISMSGRKIYSAELKLEIVERYLKGDIGIKKLAQEYHVGYGDIQKWRDAYQEHGVEGLSTTHGTYTGEFKVSVVEYMHNTGASNQTAGGTGTAANGREPKTGDASYLEVYATLAMIAGLTYLLLYVLEESRGMSEREKKAFVAAFIRWGKKGGAFRKCCAVAAIFCLLAYYHIIGKNVGGNALREKQLGQVF